MTTISSNEKVHAKMLVETNETFIYKGYLYRRSIREYVVTGPNYSGIKSFDSFEKTCIEHCALREETTSEDFHSKLKKFKKEYDFDIMWNEIKELNEDMLEFLIKIIITSEYM